MIIKSLSAKRNTGSIMMRLIMEMRIMMILNDNADYDNDKDEDLPSQPSGRAAVQLAAGLQAGRPTVEYLQRVVGLFVCLFVNTKPE
jgi:hypothetical protein